MGAVSAEAPTSLRASPSSTGSRMIRSRVVQTPYGLIRMHHSFGSRQIHLAASAAFLGAEVTAAFGAAPSARPAC